MVVVVNSGFIFGWEESMWAREKVGIGLSEESSVKQKWFESNRELLLRLMLEQKEIIKGGSTWLQDPLAFETAPLSDLPLCLAWSLAELEPPAGYELVKASVLTRGMESKSHTFMYSQNFGRVMCFCPGQFVPTAGRLIGGGSKIGELLAKAPEMFLVIDGKVGAWMLVGKRDAIRSKLGLDYNPWLNGMSELGLVSGGFDRS